MVQKYGYRKTGLVGEGQFGKVYTAINRQTGELVAVKELNPRQISTKQFLNEIHILFILNHPNIIHCYGIEHQKENRYLITEYCDGGTLRELLNDYYTLSIEYKLKIIVDILDGLNHIHRKNIVHRDLKPDNILLSVNSEGWIGKISDFGIAKFQMEDNLSSSEKMGDTGSPAYMAPEQFYGKYTSSSDLYAMGIILFEIIMGDRPFQGSPLEIMNGHLNQIPEISKKIPISLRKIIQKSLEKLPQNRFRTAEEMKMEILNVIPSLSKSKDSLYVELPHYSLNFHVIDSQEIEPNVTLLATDSNYLYQGTKDSLSIDRFNIDKLTKNVRYENQGSYQLNGELIELKSSEDGCFLVTRNSSEKKQNFLTYFDDSFQEIINWYSHDLVYGFSKKLTWFACNLNDVNLSEEGFELVNLQKINFIPFLIIDFIPQQIIEIDQNHGVVIDKQKLNSTLTYWHFFNRRGNWYHTYSMTLNIDKVIHHPAGIDTFLTREKQTNNLLLIKFLSFSIRRIPLDFKADFYVPTESGFVCASEGGDIAYLNLSGHYLGQIKINEHIIAIASIDENKLVVIIHQDGKKIRQFYSLDLENHFMIADPDEMLPD